MSDETIKKEDIDLCFIITAIGDNLSGVRRSTNGISEAVIKPILSGFGMKPIVAHEISDTGSINDQVIKHIYEDKLAIVNLTGLNPNVMYELGIRYTMRKHTILICEEGTNLPFDIVSERTIFYKNDIAGSLELSKKLKDMIGSMDFKTTPNNPIFKVLEYEKAMGEIKQEDFDDALIQKLQELINKNSREEKQDKLIFFALSKFNSTFFTNDEVQQFNTGIIQGSGFRVYPSNGVLNSRQNLFLCKCFIKSDYETAKSIITQFVHQFFKNEVEVTFFANSF